MLRLKSAEMNPALAAVVKNTKTAVAKIEFSTIIINKKYPRKSIFREAITFSKHKGRLSLQLKLPFS